MNYYNEFEPKAAAGLRQLIADGLIPAGEVDTRSIVDVKAADLKGFTQCHLFAGIGGWSRALELAGWPTSRPVWTGSCPCQPFSSVGKKKGFADDRDLWPFWFELIRQCNPETIYGEQVASAEVVGSKLEADFVEAIWQGEFAKANKIANIIIKSTTLRHQPRWLDRVYSDMEGQGYAIGAAVLPACSVGAPHKRDRLWYVAHSQCTSKGCGGIYRPAENFEPMGERTPAQSFGSRENCRHVADTDQLIGRVRDEQPTGQQPESDEDARTCSPCDMVNAVNARSQGFSGDVNNGGEPGRIGTLQDGSTSEAGFWDDYEWIECAYGKSRRIPTTESGIRLLAHGVPERVGLLRAGGNAIVVQVAARYIKATM